MPCNDTSCHCACHDDVSIGDSWSFATRRTPRNGVRPGPDYPGPWWLYEITDGNGALLYVGQSISPHTRFKAHIRRYGGRGSRNVFTIIGCVTTSWPDAFAAELELIRSRRPPDNRAGADFNRTTLTGAEIRAARQLAAAAQAEAEAAARRAYAAGYSAADRIPCDWCGLMPHEAADGGNHATGCRWYDR